ncbi:MAG: SPFH domain-containing protein [Deltaproteobacteria bacterium]|nr:SPFH domain-containing protein [Deltaproteobacteria bacterium]
MSNDHQFVFGILIGLALIPALALSLRMFRVEVEDGQALLVTRFGKLHKQLARPGWHWLVDRIMPWTKTYPVSLQSDFRDFPNICINDARGTTIVVDVWLEFRVVDPAKATFEIADWNHALKNLVSHAVISILGNREFKQILTDRTELGEKLRADVGGETARWGIQVEVAFIKNISLLPEVSQQLFHAVAARLERAKADIEEHGRQEVAKLHADTSARLATLVAEAKGQYPAAVGRAYAALKSKPAVFAAYTELYELSMMRPSQTVAFKDFEAGEMRSVEAAMLQGPAS